MSQTENVRGACRVGEHAVCKPGPVVTCFGDVALVIRCDCPCHRKETGR